MTYKQLNIYDAIESEKAARAGMQQAVEHADAVVPNWKDTTFQLFVTEFLPQHKRFLAEDFRAWLAVNKPSYDFPPSNRAFGGIMLKAKAA